ncbi:MAG TPA: DUF1631 family protein, partial [Cellvibrionaceae bacterium]|nr:DUF1631 family protein [Cellvibrionaceae bacterium]
MTDLAKVVRLEVTNERMTKARLTQLPKELHHCLEQARGLLLPLLETCLDRLEDRLFNLADKSASPHEQNTYFNAMRRVRQQRSVFLKRFGARLQEAFADLDGTQAPAAAPFTADTLALLRPEDLDELIAVEAMITKAQRSFADGITQLSQRIDALVSTPVYARNNPVGPEALCQVLSSSALQLDIPAPIKLILLQAFDDTVLSALGPVYQALVEPLKNLRANKTAVPSADVTLNTQAQTTPAQHNSFDAELASVLDGLAQGDLQIASPAQRELSNAALAEELSLLQKQKIIFDYILQPDDLLAALAGLPNKPIVLTRTQRETLHLVSVLFEFIFNEQHLAPEIIQQLAQLQIPAFKAALLDKDFFTAKGHPLRRLLNELALSAVGWSGANGEPLLRKITAVVASIGEQFERDQALFAQLLVDFTVFIGQEKRRIALCERRLVEAEDAKAVAEKARKRVSVEVGLRMDGFILSEPLRDFIANVWFQVLFVRCLRAGNDSLPWRDALQTLTDLVWSVQPLKTAKDRQALIMMVPNLMERLRAGLDDIAYDPFATADICSLINRLHRDAVAAYNPAKTQDQPPVAKSAPSAPPSASDET